MMFSWLLNLSLRILSKLPTWSFTTDLKEVNEDIIIKAPGFLWLAKYEAGPDPIDLPNNIIFFSSNPTFFIK